MSGVDLSGVDSPWHCSFVPGVLEGHSDPATLFRAAKLAYHYGRWATRLAILLGGA